MNWRVEHARPLQVLRELPDGLAHACITRMPSVDLDAGEHLAWLLAVLGETRRVLRHDGTLSLSLPAAAPVLPLLLDVAYALRREGWQPHPALASGALVRVDALQPWSCELLLAHHPYCYHDPHNRCRRRGDDSVACGSRRRAHGSRFQRRAWCIPDQARSQQQQATVELRVLESTAPVACGACGAPWRRGPNAREQWRPGCSHHDPTGRCLVLDPFCTTADTGLAALRHDRGFLGIATDELAAQDVRNRLARTGGSR